MQAADLKKGGTYFGIAFEDDNAAHLIVNSYEYTGLNAERSDKDRYFFRFLGSEDTAEFTERQLDLVLDLAGLIEALKQWGDGKLVPGRS